jgi:hypothetical protein
LPSLPAESWANAQLPAAVHNIAAVVAATILFIIRLPPVSGYNQLDQPCVLTMPADYRPGCVYTSTKALALPRFVKDAGLVVAWQSSLADDVHSYD